MFWLGFFQICEVYDNIFDAVLHGHQELAGQLVEEAMKTGRSGFGYLHQEVSLDGDTPAGFVYSHER